MWYTFHYDPLTFFVLGCFPANISGWGNGTLPGIVCIY